MGEIVHYSVEIDAEQRDLLQKKIAESQMTAGDFLLAMLANYENAQGHQSFDDSSELNQLKKCWAGIEEVYVGLTKKSKDAEENHNREMNDLIEQLVATEADLADTKAAAKVEIEAITGQMKELQEQMARQQQEDSLVIADLKEAKERAIAEQEAAQKNSEIAEQALKQLQEQVAELSANFILNQQRVVEAINELNKKSKELSTAD